MQRGPGFGALVLMKTSLKLQLQGEKKGWNKIFSSLSEWCFGHATFPATALLMLTGASAT